MKCYFDDISRFPLLSRDEEIELAERIKKNRDPEALEKMINSNLKLVVKIANGFGKYGLPVEDLVAEGNIGLMKAAEKFDPAYGVKFSTYASWWIKQRVKRALGNQSRTIRLPLYILQKLRDLDQVERELGDELGRDPAEDELAEKSGITARKAAQLRRAYQPIVSMDERFSDDGTDRGDIGATVSDERAENPSDVALEKDLVKNLTEVLSVLDDRERKIVTSRFGIDGSDPLTLEQIGVTFGVTRERIRQIQKEAISKLRAAWVRREKSHYRIHHVKNKARRIAQDSQHLETLSA